MPTEVGNLGVYIIFKAPAPLIAVFVREKAQVKPDAAVLGIKLIGIFEVTATVLLESSVVQALMPSEGVF